MVMNELLVFDVRLSSYVCHVIKYTILVPNISSAAAVKKEGVFLLPWCQQVVLSTAFELAYQMTLSINSFTMRKADAFYLIYRGSSELSSIFAEVAKSMRPRYLYRSGGVSRTSAQLPDIMWVSPRGDWRSHNSTLHDTACCTIKQGYWCYLGRWKHTTGVSFFHMKPFFQPVNIRHTVCPCWFFIFLIERYNIRGNGKGLDNGMTYRRTRYAKPNRLTPAHWKWEK